MYTFCSIDANRVPQLRAALRGQEAAGVWGGDTAQFCTCSGNSRNDMISRLKGLIYKVRLKEVNKLG